VARHAAPPGERRPGAALLYRSSSVPIGVVFVLTVLSDPVQLGWLLGFQQSQNSIGQLAAFAGVNGATTVRTAGTPIITSARFDTSPRLVRQAGWPILLMYLFARGRGGVPYRRQSGGPDALHHLLSFHVLLVGGHIRGCHRGFRVICKGSTEW
jgi:hypothetical protein